MTEGDVEAAKYGYFPTLDRLGRIALGLIVLSLAGSLLNQQSYRMSGVSLVWLPNGLLIGILLRSAKRQWPAFLVLAYAIDLTLNLVQHNAAGLAAYLSLCNLVEVLAAAWLMYPAIAPDPDLTEPRQLRCFLVFGVLLSPALAALMATCFLRIEHGTPLSESLRYWYAADLLGIATVTPLYLSWSQGKAFSHRSRAEVTGLFLLLCLTAPTVFFLTTYPMLWLLLMVLLLLGVRLGFTAAAMGLLAVIFIGGYLTVSRFGASEVQGHGALATRILFFQCFIALSMFAIYVVDVAMSANQRIQLSLEASENRFRSMAEASSDIILLAGLDRIPVYVSPAVTELMGWEQQELAGIAFGSFARPDDRDGLTKTLDDLLLGHEPRSFAYQSRRKDGTYIWLEATARLMRDETTHQPTGFVCVLRDISDRKVAEAQMQAAFEKVEQLAMMDGLTGVANRRLLDQVIQREWQSGRRDQTPLSLLLIDVDHFKAYNDHYGHLAGDECLRRVARVIESSLRRPLDLVARYGGEEFAGVLPNTPERSADIPSEMVRQAVENCNILHAGSPRGIVTISVGCATGIPSSASNADHLLLAADAALYKAKRNGRNRREVTCMQLPVHEAAMPVALAAATPMALGAATPMALGLAPTMAGSNPLPLLPV